MDQVKGPLVPASEEGKLSLSCGMVVDSLKRMPKACYSDLSLLGVCVCHGPQKRTLEDDRELFAEAPESLTRLRDFVGIEARWLAPKGITTLDLGEQAARRLMDQGAVDPASLDGVIFVTQTPDHFQPSNANLLHGRLGLSKEALAFDVNQGCSGWIYGLYLACSLLQSGGCERILLLAGDTVTQRIHPRDRALRPLFSDACAATIVEKKPGAGPWWFDLYSDGTGHEAIKIPAGAHRWWGEEECALETVDEEGSVRSPNDLRMDGLAVFNFTLREEPPALRRLAELAQRELSEADALVLHQANRFILENLAKRLKVPLEKVPRETLRAFGNQSSASIPAVLCHELGARLQQEPLFLFCSGFGVGLSWGGMAGSVGPLSFSEIFGFQMP